MLQNLQSSSARRNEEIRERMGKNKMRVDGIEKEPGILWTYTKNMI